MKYFHFHLFILSPLHYISIRRTSCELEQIFLFISELDQRKCVFSFIKTYQPVTGLYLNCVSVHQAFDECKMVVKISTLSFQFIICFVFISPFVNLNWTVTKWHPHLKPQKFIRWITLVTVLCVRLLFFVQNNWVNKVPEECNIYKFFFYFVTTKLISFMHNKMNIQHENCK